MSGLPYYIDDPLVPRDDHKLTLYSDRGQCSCGWGTPSEWEHHGVFEAYDAHMAEVQAAAHKAATS